MLKFLKSFPFLSASFVQAVIALVIAMGLHLTAGQTGAIEAAAAAVLALATAPHVTPPPVPLIIGALTAAGALLIAFKIPGVSSAEVSAFVLAISALLGTTGHTAVTSKVLAADRARSERF
jgi:hypothetical protein